MGWVGGWVLVPFWTVFSSLISVISPILNDLLSLSVPDSLFLTHSLTISLFLSRSIFFSLSLLLSLSLSLSLRSFWLSLNA